MTDPRSRLRPLVHSGVRHKVDAALDEIEARDEPALYDWLLEACEVRDLAMSVHWRWKYDDVQELRHPSLEPEQALRLAARGNSTLAGELRRALPRLGIELAFNRRAEPYLDVSMLDRMIETTKLRVLAKDPENLWEWRAEMAKTPAKPLRGFASIAGMAKLRQLVVIGGAGVELAALAGLALDRVELIACDVSDTRALADCTIRELAIVACPAVREVASPRGLERLVLEDLPLAAPPAVPSGVTLVYERERSPRTSF